MSRALFSVFVTLFFVTLHSTTADVSDRQTDMYFRRFPVCSKCPEDEYETKECYGEEDTYCIHPTNPYKKLSDGPFSVYPGHVTVTQDRNIFVEDLLTTQTLSETIYISRRRQNAKFRWTRASGLQIHVNLTDANILPEYVDVDHKSDNDVLRNDSNSYSDVIKKMAKVRQHYCRHPIPDSYTIFQRVYPSRTTAVEQISCASKTRQAGVVRCPSDYTEHDIFTYRSINKPCKHTSQKGHLHFNSNNFHCTQNTPLLNQIFNRTIHEEFLTFPTDKSCSDSLYQCNTCLTNAQADCKLGGAIDGACCGTSCYNNPWCRRYYQTSCVDQPVECATGDTMQFTLQPSFRSIKDGTFFCHLRYQPPKKLYTVAYSVSIIRAGFKVWSSPKFIQTMSSDDLQSHNDKTMKMGIMYVKHATFFKLRKELILRGEPTNTTPGEPFTFHLHEFKERSEFNTSRIPIKKYGAKNLLVNVQVFRPFDISTSQWINLWCYMNTSLLYPNQTMYRPRYITVKAIHDKTRRKEMRYFFSRDNVRPKIRFELPGTRSVLRPQFCDKNSETRWNGIPSFNDVTTQLKKLPHREWSIHVKGMVNATPAYLQLHLHELRSRRILLKQDAVVLGPRHRFRLVLTVRAAALTAADVAFRLTLADCVSTRRAYLTTLAQRQSPPPPPPTPSMSSHFTPEVPGSPYLILLLATVTLGTVYALLLLLLLLLRCWRRPAVRRGRAARLQAAVQTHLAFQRRQRLPFRRKVVVVAYLCFRAFYNFLFTFSVLASLLLSLEAPSVMRLRTSPRAQKALLDDFRIQFDRLEAFGAGEMARQLERALQQHRACDLNVGASLGNLTAAYQAEMRLLLRTMFSSTTSLANQTHRMVNKRLLGFRERLQQFLDTHRIRMIDNLNFNYAPYGSLIRKVYRSPWFNFPQRLFNASNHFVDSLYDYALRRSNLDRTYVDFLTFVRITEAERLHLLPTRLWKRLDAAVPSPESIRIEPSATRSGQSRPSHLLRRTPDRVHVNRYFSTFGTAGRSLGLDGTGRPLRTVPLNRVVHKVFAFPVSLVKIRLALLCLDLVLLAYRFYHTSATARLLWYGRPCHIHDADIPLLLTDERLAQELRARLPQSPPTTPDTDPLQPSPRATSSYHRRRSASSRCCCYSLHFLALVVGLAISAVALCFLVMFDAGFYPERLVNAGKFLRRFDTLQANGAIVNELVNKHAAFINAHHLPQYRRANERINQRLQSLNKRYNNEKTNILHHYQKEMCTIQKSLCGNENSPTYVNVIRPLPCGFLNLKSVNYSDYLKPYRMNRYSSQRDYLRIFSASIVDSGIFLQVKATRALVFTTSIVLLVTFSILAVLHLTGVLCLQWLSLPTVPVRLTSELPRPQEESSPGFNLNNSDTQESRV